MGDCHYLDGNVYTSKRIPVVEQLLDLAGIGRSRLQLRWVSAAEGLKFAKEVEATRAVVGRVTAERFDWQVGDRIPIQGTIWRQPDESAWEFDLVGIFDGAEKSTDETPLLLHYEWLDEVLSQSWGSFGQVGWYAIRIADPEAAPQLAERLDRQFANSSYETKTATEKAFIQSFANQTGNIAKIVAGIVGVVFFTMLLVAGNTMAQSVRERTGELAVWKTLGFSDRQVMGMVLGESFFFAAVGGGTNNPGFPIPPGAYLSTCCPAGGFGIRGVEGKIACVRFARENRIPYLYCGV